MQSDYLERVPLGKPFGCRVLFTTGSGDRTWARLEAWPQLDPPEVFDRVIVPPDMNLRPTDIVEVEVRLCRVFGMSEHECRDQAALGDPFFMVDTPEKTERADRVVRTMAILRRRTPSAQTR